MNDLVTPGAGRNPEWEVGWELRAFNGGLRRRRKAAGLTQKQLGRLVGTSAATIGHVETMRQRPTDELRAALADHFGCDPQEIWPDWLESRHESLRAEVYQSVNAAEFSALEMKAARDVLAIADQASAGPERAAVLSEAADVIEKALGTLTRRQAEVVRMRYGIGRDRPLTLDECGKELGISRERVRQTEMTAVRKLSNGERRDLLKGPADDCLSLHPCPTCATHVPSFQFCAACPRVCCDHCITSHRDASFRKLCPSCLAASRPNPARG